MASISDFNENLAGKITAYVNKASNIGSVFNTTGIDVFELDAMAVDIKPVSVSSGDFVVSGEALKVSNGNFVPAVIGTDTPTHIAICELPAKYTYRLNSNNGDNRFAGFKDGDVVKALPLEDNEAVRLVLKAGEAISKNDLLTFGSDGISLVKATSGDTAYFKAVLDAEQYNGVVVVRKVQVLS